MNRILKQCLVLLQSSIAERIRLSISWCNVASDATHKERNYDRIQERGDMYGLIGCNIW